MLAPRHDGRDRLRAADLLRAAEMSERARWRRHADGQHARPTDIHGRPRGEAIASAPASDPALRPAA